MTQLRLMVFGPPRLERGGQPIDLGLRKAVALCAYLAVSRRPQSRDALATLLWPDRDQREARASLRRTLHRLAQAAGDELLQASADTVAIHPAADLWVDAAAFERLVEDDPAAAVALYRDDFLAGFTLADSAAFDEWQFFERERLRQLLARTLERLSRLAQARADWDAATSYARRWVALDQLHEPAQRALLEAYAQSGQAAAAQRQYQELARALEAELGAEPEPATTELFEAIRARRFPPPPAPAPLAEAAPAPPQPAAAPSLSATPLVGRERELAELLQLLGAGDGPRLVTLTGPGGAGKTRLAQAVVERMQPRLADGAHLVSLAEVAEPAGIARAVAAQLGLPLRGGDVAGQLLGALRERELLLALDNFEHLLEGSGLVAAIIGAAPRARLLITSRERLGLGEELVYALGGLRVPAEGAGVEALAADAAQLLLQRARLVRPELAPGPAEAAAIARVCRLVQGMPLALTLAAGWAELLSFAEIGDEIAHSLHFLSTDQRDVPERQRSIRAVFEGSWGRLSADARRAFARLTVFRGGLTRRAAESVAGADLQTLRRLVNSSFLTANTQAQRYEIHELLRQLAAEACAGDPTIAEAQAAHSAYYLDQLRRLTGDLKGARQRAATAELAADFDNLRAAWQHAVAQADGVAIAAAAEGFWIFCELYGDAATGEAAFAGALAALEGGDEGLAGFLLAARGHFHARRSAFASGRELMERGVARMRAAPSQLPIGLALVYLGFLCRYEGRFADAERLGEESLACFAAADDHWGVALSLQLMGTSLARQGRPALAQQLLQACLETARGAGAYGSRSFAAWNLARVLAGFGDYPAAQRLLEEAIAVGQEAGYRLSVASALTERALLALDLGELDAAGRDFAASIELYEAIGSPVFAETTRAYTGILARLRGDLPTAEALLRRGLEQTRSLQNSRDEALLLGELALVAARQGDLPRALRLQEDALAIWRATGNEPGVAAAACQLAATQVALGARAAVVEGLAQTALDLALRHRLAPVALAACLSLAQLLAGRGELEAAAELLALAEAHPAASFETRAQAAALAAELCAGLPPAVAAAARERGAALDWRALSGRWAADPQSAAARGRAAPTNLDNELQPLIGRDWQLAELAGLLSLPERRLVTLHGPGGIGKSRLAQEAGLVALEQFPDGAWLVPLAPLADPEQLAGAIAEALGLRPGAAGDPREQLLGYLRPRRLLLILDNFEQLIAGAGLLAEILRHAPRATLLVTSRERLNLADELVVPLGGIEVPPDTSDERALERGAVQLLLQRARQARPVLDLSPAELDAVIRICRLVDGMPLALILAASWADMLSFTAITAEIARSLGFLEGELRDLPARQRSVRAVFDVAWQRLPAAAQLAFARLSAFRGGFTREAAARVAEADLRTLRVLLNSAFIVAEPAERYGIHELLRQYGAERLAELREGPGAFDRHSVYYLELLEGLEPDLRRARQAETFQAIEADLENIRQAWGHAIERRDRPLIDRALNTLYLFSEKRGRFRQGVELLLQARDQLAQTPEEDGELWQRLTTRLSLLSSHFPRGQRVPLLEIEHCLALAVGRGAAAEEALSSFAFGQYYGRTEKDFAAALVHFEAAHRLYQALDDRFYLAESLARIGICKGYVGDIEAFYQDCRAGYTIAQADDNLIGMLIAQGNLLEALVHRGEYGEAAECAGRQIALAEQLGARNGVAHAMEFLALARFLEGDLAAARAAATRGYALSAELSNAGTMASCLSVQALHAAVSGDHLLALRFAAEGEAEWPNRLANVQLHWALALAQIGLGRHGEAAASLRAAAQAAALIPSPAPRVWLLPVAAVLAAQGGDEARAAELLALAETHPFRAAGWMRRWAALATLRGELEATLGANAFAAAWERGAARPLEAVVAELAGKTLAPEPAPALKAPTPPPASPR